MDSPTKKDVRPNAIVYFTLSFRQLCLFTVSLPLVALFTCFVTAYIFQQDDIHETHCRVSTHYSHTETNRHYIATLFQIGVQYHTINQCRNRNQSTAISVAYLYSFTYWSQVFDSFRISYLSPQFTSIRNRSSCKYIKM